MDIEITSSWVVGLIGGVILGACAQIAVGVKEWIQTNAERKRAANYAALRASSILESFALACANKIDENEEYDTWFHQLNKENVSLPQLESYPKDIDWMSLTPKLVAKSLSFSNEVMLGNRKICLYASAPNASPDDGKDFSSLVCGLLGLRALNLANELRRSYGLEDYSLAVGDYVLNQLEEYNKKYADFRKTEKAMWG